MDIKFDSSGDISLSKGLLELEGRGERVVKSRLNITLSTNKTEWQFNVDLGLPYITKDLDTQILGKSEFQYIEAVTRQAILAIPDVVRIDNLVLDFDKLTRKLSITAHVETTSGNIIFTTGG